MPKHIEMLVGIEGLISAMRANKSWCFIELAAILIASNSKGANRRLFKDGFFFKPSVRLVVLLF
ncbi:MAG: hypothetical protein U1E02_34640 [Hydrogenophaga sp.]|nr:hypothetical protein [Hydrogenophaga sp.]